jgi:hypothetical protein
MTGVLLGTNGIVMAQKIASDSTFCNPSILGTARPKGVVFKYEHIADYYMRSVSARENFPNSKNEIKLNRRIEFKAKVPLWIRPNITVAAGFKYATEQYQFEQTGSDNSLENALDGKMLKSIGGTLYVVKPWKGKRYLMLRAGADLNGDYQLKEVKNTHFLRLSFSPLFGIKRDDYTTYAIGFSYNNIFGRSTLSPVLVFNQTFNSHWGIELTLPASAKLRYSRNRKTFVYATAVLNGANYSVRLSNPELTQYHTLYLQRSEIRLLLNYEREVFNFLWFGIEAGLMIPNQYVLAESTFTRRAPIVRSTLNQAVLLNASLFLVPPRKHN